jgi:enoyl-CoA hydratase
VSGAGPNFSRESIALSVAGATGANLHACAVCYTRHLHLQTDFRAAMSNAWFELEHADGIARLTLSRPGELNTLSVAMLRAMRETVETLDAVGRTRVMIVASTGKHFTAGMQVEEFSPETGLLDVGDARARLAFQALLRDLMRCFDALETARFPVIAAIQGGCIGGGVDLATACDMRFCTSDAFFCVQEINLAIVADLGTLQRLPKIIAPGVARELAFAGRRMPATRAREVGLVNEIFADPASLHTGVDQLAREIAAKSPIAIAGTKAALNHARDHGVAEALDRMSVLQSAILNPAEIAASVAAGRTKRAAAFADLAGDAAGADRES